GHRRRLRPGYRLQVRAVPPEKEGQRLRRSSEMRLLLYGGTFDPPHNGHLNNLAAAAARVAPDQVVVMPAGVPPHKRASATPADLRLEMCRCFYALAQGPNPVVPRLEVSRWEIDQAEAGRRNYTVLTLEM